VGGWLLPQVTNHVTLGGAAGVARPALGEQWRHQPSLRVQLALGEGDVRSAELVATTARRGDDGRVQLVLPG
jgi:hypothetical protein